MADAYAEAVMTLEEEIDSAITRARSELSTEEIVEELRRITKAWEEEP